MNSVYRERIKKLQVIIKNSNCDALFVSDPLNIRYLSNFSLPDDAKIIISNKKAYLLTDFRYSNSKNLHPEFKVCLWKKKDIFEEINKITQNEKIKVLGFEKDGLTVLEREILNKKTKVKLKGTVGIIEGQRIVKDSYELKIYN